MHRHQVWLIFATVTSIVCSAAVLFAQGSAVSPTNDNKPTEKPARKMNHPADSEDVIEILTLDIKPGRRDEFHQVYVTQALPLLKKWNFAVVAYGPSLHDANSYYVIRRFKSLEEREKSENAYYGSDDWKGGPREKIFELVDHFAYAVVSEDTWKKVPAAFDASKGAAGDHDQETRHETGKRVR
jgi:NIPSNAP